jgi:catechol-2,3-dioxygenase
MNEARITGVRSVTLGVADLPACASFYENVWGLEPVLAAEDAVYLRTSGVTHPVLVLKRHASSALLDLNLETVDRKAVDALYARLRKSPSPPTHAPLEFSAAGRAEYGFSFTGLGLPPITIVAAAQAGGAGAQPVADAASRISHVVINTPNRVDAAKFCQDFLGFALSDYTNSMHFLRCNSDHHSLALADGAQIALNHIAYEVPSLDAMMRCVARVQNAGFPIEWGVGRHGPGNNIFAYFMDPAGFVPEFTTEMEQVSDDNRPTGTPAQWNEFWKKMGVARDRWGMATKPSARVQKAMDG